MGHAETVAARLGGRLLEARSADVGAARERARQRRLARLAAVLALPATFLWVRILRGQPFDVFALPPMPEDPILYVLPVVLIVALIATAAMPLASGRSPHQLVRPEQISVRFADVMGLGAIVDEVEKTLNTFLAYALYRDRLGGNPRRGLLFEGAPGTGKTHLAKAMAREAGVPFLFVSATSFQSMWYGATARKIRSYFRVLRATARREGGAIGFIEEIDAIAGARGGLQASTAVGAAASPWSIQRFASTEGAGGVVNELLVQMQSFDAPTTGQRVVGALVGAANRFLPEHRRLRVPADPYANILLIAATNRADSLDPALLRPGRFDRRLEFTLPAKAARAELLGHFLARKAHAVELDDEGLRDQLAAQTVGYTPVLLEHLLDEALVLALRDGRDRLAWRDVQRARLVGEVGLATPAPYTERERLTVATHEAGHATVAYLAGDRRLEVLSIVKRKDSLGLLAHGDVDEVYTRSRAQMYALVEIALGGLCAEELVFGEAGTGPSGDLREATRVACEIVGAAGMAGTLVSLAAVRNTAFNDSNLAGRVLADPLARPRVERLLSEAKARVSALLAANAHLVEALRDALLAGDELVGDEILAVLAAAGPPVPATAGSGGSPPR
jgi:ATP-dependent Zn protease